MLKMGFKECLHNWKPIFLKVNYLELVQGGVSGTEGVGGVTSTICVQEQVRTGNAMRNRVARKRWDDSSQENEDTRDSRYYAEGSVERTLSQIRKPAWVSRQFSSVSI